MGVAAWQLAVSVIGTLGVIGSLLIVARSNRRLASVQNLNNLQLVLAEMNKLRTYRAEHPDLERTLFSDREKWTDVRIQSNIMAVQLANIFEWAFVAHRQGLLDEDVWRSWIATWRNVILASGPLRASFVDTVWTFGREPSVAEELRRLLDLGEMPGRSRNIWSS